MATISEQFHAEMASVATDLLSPEQMGGNVPFKRYSGGQVDPVTGSATAATSEVYSPNGGVMDYKESVIDGARIMSGDKLVIIDAATYTPDPSDKAVIEGQEWSIIEINKKAFAGIPIGYKVQVRK